LMVVGAGRGPIVKAALRAGKRAFGSEEECAKNLKVYALDKNPNAVVTLQNLKVTIWGDQVTVINEDMRTWDAPEKADILVSELLGSFGDNELSPECLDGAQRFLKADGISIPCDSVSYISPISSSKLWSDVKAFDKYQELKHFETSYVVKMHTFHEMAPPQACFYFWHPNNPNYPPLEHTLRKRKPLGNADLKQKKRVKSEVEISVASGNERETGFGRKVVDNSRYVMLSFDIRTANTLHGFAGYFESKLYKDISISIYPPTFSTGMFSWFPLYFPLRNPLYISANSRILVHFWRNVSEEQRTVWYEWCIEGTGPYSGLTSGIHNPNGRSSNIRF